MINPVMIFGANHLGKRVFETLKKNGVVVYGFLDDNKKLHGQEIEEVSVLGESDDEGFLKLIGKKCDYYIAEEDLKARKRMFELLVEARKTMPVNVFHSQAQLAKNAVFGYGIFVGGFSVLEFGVSVGSLSSIHHHVVVGVESKIGECCDINHGVRIGSEVVIEDNVFIGAGATIVSGITIGKNARIGAGSVVVEPVKNGTTVFGNPAKAI
ncbi:MAG: NeuD/PglB/VioB family sugar acetyltransferase [Cytophagales bacterium]